MPWDDLPPGVQRNVLSFVPLSARLRNCSLVNRTMYQAAAAATQQLEHLRLNDRAGRTEGLEKWLNRHGEHITSLQLEDVVVKQRMLCSCPHLQQLHLHTCLVLLNPSSTFAQSTRLTKLVLDGTFFGLDYGEFATYDGEDATNKMAAALTVMPNLQHLALLSPSWSQEGDNLPSDVLQHLPQLTHLSLSGGEQSYTRPTAPVLQHVSTLQHLQELCLTGPDTPTISLCLSLSTTPGITCLTALTWLELSSVGLDVAVLPPLTKLRKLSLRFIELPPVCEMAALLTYIPQQVLLQDLQFQGVSPKQRLSPAPGPYAGLTASSALQDLGVALSLSDCQHGVWQHVFPAGRTLLHCTGISLSCPSVASGLGSSDISNLVSCCPSLKNVVLPLQPEVGLMPLTRLTALTELTLCYPLPGCIQPVSALTWLRKLTLRDSTGTELRDCLPLVRLQQLTLLRLEVPAPRGTYMMSYKWSAGKGEPPVWQQLMQEIASLTSLTLETADLQDEPAA